MDKIRIAVMWHRLGPYHHARLRAAARCARLTAIEMSGEDNTYAWDKVPRSDGFRRVTVFPTCDCDTRPIPELVRRLTAVLAEIKPDVLAIPSWGEKYALAGLAWSLRTGTPNLVMSDSNEYDKTRRWWVELVKRCVIRHFQAGIVSSKERRTYLETLGMPNERVFVGYNVVDNDYFARGAEDARRDADRVRSEPPLPKRYLLASARFVNKKNLPYLLDAFARYRELAGQGAWVLVLLGDGALRPRLERQGDALGLQGSC